MPMRPISSSGSFYLIGVPNKRVSGATFVVLCSVARYARRKLLSSCLQLRF